MPELMVVGAYDPLPDAYRVLVDRLWPRGIRKERLALDEWPKEICPTTALRKAFHAGDITDDAFVKAYENELHTNDTFEPWRKHIRLLLQSQDVCFITAVRAEHRVHPYVLCRLVQEEGSSLT